MKDLMKPFTTMDKYLESMERLNKISEPLRAYTDALNSFNSMYRVCHSLAIPLQELSAKMNLMRNTVDHSHFSKIMRANEYFAKTAAATAPLKSLAKTAEQINTICAPATCLNTYVQNISKQFNLFQKTLHDITSFTSIVNDPAFKCLSSPTTASNLECILNNEHLLNEPFDAPSSLETTLNQFLIDFDESNVVESFGNSSDASTITNTPKDVPSSDKQPITVGGIISFAADLMGIYVFICTQITDETPSILNEILRVIRDILIAVFNYLPQ